MCFPLVFWDHGKPSCLTRKCEVNATSVGRRRWRGRKKDRNDVYSWKTDGGGEVWTYLWKVRTRKTELLVYLGFLSREPGHIGSAGRQSWPVEEVISWDWLINSISDFVLKPFSASGIWILILVKNLRFFFLSLITCEIWTRKAWGWFICSKTLMHILSHCSWWTLREQMKQTRTVKGEAKISWGLSSSSTIKWAKAVLTLLSGPVKAERADCKKQKDNMKDDTAWAWLYLWVTGWSCWWQLV